MAGNYYSLKGHHERAVTYFQRALRVNAKFLSAWILMVPTRTLALIPVLALIVFRTRTLTLILTLALTLTLTLILILFPPQNPTLPPFRKHFHLAPARPQQRG